MLLDAGEGAGALVPGLGVGCWASLWTLAEHPFCVSATSALSGCSDPTKDPEGLMSNFGQLYTGIKSGTPDHFQANHQLWNVEYVGEGSIDVG